MFGDLKALPEDPVAFCSLQLHMMAPGLSPLPALAPLGLAAFVILRGVNPSQVRPLWLLLTQTTCSGQLPWRVLWTTCLAFPLPQADVLKTADGVFSLSSWKPVMWQLDVTPSPFLLPK